MIVTILKHKKACNVVFGVVLSGAIPESLDISYKTHCRSVAVEAIKYGSPHKLTARVADALNSAAIPFEKDFTPRDKQ